MKVVVMGVSGCGKTTFGAALAAKAGAQFVEADELHSPASVALMSAGIPLTDNERWPWLHAVGARLAGPQPAVAACSALARRYRDVLRGYAPGVQFIHLHGSPGVLHQRLAGRQDHFMPASLLDSQLASLEPLGADEAGFILDIATDLDSAILLALGRLTG